MRRGSRKVFAKSAAKSREFDFSPERTEYSPSWRLGKDFMTPVQRQAWHDEGNKAFKALLARNRGFQAAAASLQTGARQRAPLTLKTRPTRVFAALKGTVSAPIRRGVAVVLDSAPTAKKISEAVICAKRQVRRELVFASGGAGSRRTVPQRAAPSKVRC